MLPTSHFSPIQALPAPAPPPEGDVLLLADAFSAFIEASARLEGSYRELQVEVGQLGSELAVRNAALEESLLENEAMRLALVEIVDSLPCGVLVLGADENILRINPEAYRLLRLPSSFCEQLVSAADLTLMATATGVDLRPFCRMGGESEFSIRPAERKIWLQMRTRRLVGQSAGAHTILILTDISAHKEAEENREAGRRAVALAEVAATLAHEMRNPLASLELFTNLLEDEPERANDWLVHVRAGLRGLAGTVNNVLSFHGAGMARLRPLQLANAARMATEFARPLVEQAGIELAFSADEQAGAVMADETGLQQLVLNLIINAVRHAGTAGQIHVAVSGVSQRLRLSVSDNGSGIAREHLEQVFLPGWSARGASTGLGLAVCRRIAEQHGARLWAESELGNGAKFNLEMESL